MNSAGPLPTINADQQRILQKQKEIRNERDKADQREKDFQKIFNDTRESLEDKAEEKLEELERLIKLDIVSQDQHRRKFLELLNVGVTLDEKDQNIHKEYLEKRKRAQLYPTPKEYKEDKQREDISTSVDHNGGNPDSQQVSLLLLKMCDHGLGPCYFYHPNNENEPYDYKTIESYLFQNNATQIFLINYESTENFLMSLIHQNSLKEMTNNIRKRIVSLLNPATRITESDILFLDVRKTELPVGLTFKSKVPLKNQDIKKLASSFGMRFNPLDIKGIVRVPTNIIQSKMQDWIGLAGKKSYRGALKMGDNLEPQPYYFPVGYLGYPFRLVEKSQWIDIKEDEQAWITLYSRVRGRTPREIIMEDSFTCELTNLEVKLDKMELVDLAESVDLLEGSSQIMNLDEKMYVVLLQCKVNPKAVRRSANKPQFYAVQSSQDVRVIRILLKQLP